MSGVVWLFDPAVFVDDDGTGYLNPDTSAAVCEIKEKFIFTIDLFHRG
jgi:hypothetical protein